MGTRKWFKDSKEEICWILYDVGNSAFTLLASIVLPIYFNYLVTSAGLSDERATSMWAYAASAVTLVTAFLSPILGNLADYKGFKRPLFFFSALIGILFLCSLSIPMPWLIFLILYVFSKIFYSVSLVFYDGMINDITTFDRVDMISSKGYAFGYIGSVVPFIISIVIIQFSPLDYSISMPIAFFLNAAWWLGFTIPLAKTYKQKTYSESRPRSAKKRVSEVFALFTEKMDNKKGILLFLLSFFFYIDGVYTVIDMATSFGTSVGIDTMHLLLALLVTQFVAFPAALIFGKLAKKIRNDNLILISIIAYLGVSIFAIFLKDAWQFWVLAVVVGLFQGGVQALSRSYFAKIIPVNKSGYLFGIMDIFGKGASFTGTLLVGLVTDLTNNVNLGVIPISCLFVVGLVLFVLARNENNNYLTRQEETIASVEAASSVDSSASN